MLDKNNDVTAYERHYTSCLLSTCHRRNSSPAISTSWPQPWSCGQASAYDWRNTPSELCYFHSQSQGRCCYFRTALETLSTRSGESDRPPARKRFFESEFDSGQPGIWHMIATVSWRQMHATIIFCLNFSRQLQTNNEQTRTQKRPTHWQLASEVDPHGPSRTPACTVQFGSELFRVAWDFDSPWITGPMTAHQSVAYARHIILVPAANLCTLSAIVFLPIKTWIWHHSFADTSTAAPFCWLSADPYDPDD